jgi:RHS repeat-associated protein
MLLQEGTDTRYIYGPDGLPVEQVKGTTATFLHHDQIGSTRLITNTSGTTTGTYTFDAYGKQTSHTLTDSTNLAYAGQYTDAETGFQYLRARYYDPTTGNFLSRDPATELTRLPYGYTYGNPLSNVDRNGLWPWDDVGEVIEQGARLADAVEKTVGNAAEATGEFIVEHRGDLANVAAGITCVGTAGSACGVAVVVAASINAQQTAENGGDLGDISVSVFKSAALALPGLAEFGELGSAGQAAALFEKYPFLASEGWAAPSWFQFGLRGLNAAALNAESLVSLWRSRSEC